MLPRIHRQADPGDECDQPCCAPVNCQHRPRTQNSPTSVCVECGQRIYFQGIGWLTGPQLDVYADSFRLQAWDVGQVAG